MSIRIGDIRNWTVLIMPQTNLAKAGFQSVFSLKSRRLANDWNTCKRNLLLVRSALMEFTMFKINDLFENA